jgi:hypothetical protein
MFARAHEKRSYNFMDFLNYELSNYKLGLTFFGLMGKGVTRINFLMDGVLIREMMSNPLLLRYRSEVLSI